MTEMPSPLVYAFTALIGFPIAMICWNLAQRIARHRKWQNEAASIIDRQTAIYLLMASGLRHAMDCDQSRQYQIDAIHMFHQEFKGLVEARQTVSSFLSIQQSAIFLRHSLHLEAIAYSIAEIAKALDPDEMTPKAVTTFADYLIDFLHGHRNRPEPNMADISLRLSGQDIHDHMRKILRNLRDLNLTVK